MTYLANRNADPIVFLRQEGWEYGLPWHLLYQGLFLVDGLFPRLIGWQKRVERKKKETPSTKRRKKNEDQYFSRWLAFSKIFSYIYIGHSVQQF